MNSSYQCRVLGSTLQHYVLYACKKVFICLPILLEVFRDEGGWEFIFSNNFFYFGFSLDESSVESHRYVDGSKNYGLGYDLHVSCSTLETIQMEVISFVEFAATLDGNMSNLVLLLFMKPLHLITVCIVVYMELLCNANPVV